MSSFAEPCSELVRLHGPVLVSRPMLPALVVASLLPELPTSEEHRRKMSSIREPPSGLGGPNHAGHKPGGWRAWAPDFPGGESHTAAAATEKLMVGEVRKQQAWPTRSQCP